MERFYNNTGYINPSATVYKRKSIREDSTPSTSQQSIEEITLNNPSTSQQSIEEITLDNPSTSQQSIEEINLNNPSTSQQSLEEHTLNTSLNNTSKKYTANHPSTST
ncbi:unnamed protein product [Psylliodes chrysocephalus]|uniref:Uncharacterized protein n=1 Tax=Psylliodes chrysocephalus TaxID=3402493 RepID=A0A9P0CW99_9CUCU|nr:unnamed protein product [Psylliodes chrysocephala]